VANGSTPLIIVESPAKARTLSKFLGGRYQVKASMGAVRDLPKEGIGVDENNDFAQTYVINPNKTKTVRELKEAAKGASEVLLATDPDREGEAISWHLAQALRLINPIRIEFHEITKSAVDKAIASPRALDNNLVNAQIARRVLDRLVGYKISPILFRKISGAKSAGRVQSVAVRLICEREDEIDAFKSQEYWSLEALLKATGKEPDFKARLLTKGVEDKDKKKEDTEGAFYRPEIKDEQTAKIIKDELQKAQYKILSVDKKEQTRNPPKPYITSSIQQDASTRLYFNPKRTMAIAQQLYEGVEIGSAGPVGLITYMRTDSIRIAPEAEAAAKQFIEKTWGVAYCKTGAASGGKAKSPVAAQDAHEAIRPTDVTRTPKSLQANLSEEQHKLYTLIWKRFVASQMATAKFDTTKVDISADKYRLRANGSILRFEGFYKVWERKAENDDELGIPELSIQDALSLLDLISEQHFTQPPPRYTEASLIKELEEKGIGRPSTYASTVGTIQERQYVETLERKLHPTSLGKTVNTFLIANFGNLFEYDFTANMENELDKIAKGTAWLPFMHSFNNQLKGFLGKANDAESFKRTGETCPECNQGELIVKQGRFGLFTGCERYPECKYIRKDEGMRIAPVETGEPCPQCGKPLVFRKSKKGEFEGCSGYPNCTYIKGSENRPAAQETGEKCPKCTKPLLMRQGKRGPFVGCSGFPKCRYIASSKIEGDGTGVTPVVGKTLDEKCSKCGSSMVLREGRYGEFKSCSNYPKCKGPAKKTKGKKRAA
jgi:DNA topoisomerase-1